MLQKLPLFFVAMLLMMACGQQSKQAPQGPDVIGDTIQSSTEDSLLEEMQLAYARSIDYYSSEQFYKYVEYIDPAYFKHQNPQSPDDAKSDYVDMLSERTSKQWESVYKIAPEARSFGYQFSGVEDAHFSGRNYLVLFHQRAYYVNNNDTIRDDESTLGIATYLDSLQRWYFIDPSVPNIREILLENFSEMAVKYILDREELKNDREE